MNKFVLDTNLLVSAFLFPASIPGKAFDKALHEGKLLTSEETFNEFELIFSRSKFEKYVPIASRLKVISDFRSLLTFHTVSIRITDCRDIKDNKFLELAVTAQASCIITGDNDLLELNPFRGIAIINASDFLYRF